MSTFTSLPAHFPFGRLVLVLLDCIGIVVLPSLFSPFGTMVNMNEKNLKAVPQEDVDVQDISTLEAQTLTKPMGKWETFYRGTLFQMLVTGAVAFAGPAMSDGKHLCLNKF